MAIINPSDTENHAVGTQLFSSGFAFPIAQRVGVVYVGIPTSRKKSIIAHTPESKETIEPVLLEVAGERNATERADLLEWFNR